MSGTLLAGLSLVDERIDEITREGCRFIAALTGKSKSTAHRWGTCVDTFPLGPALKIADQDAQLRAAILYALGEHPEPRPLRALSGCHEHIQQSSRLICKVSEAVADGRIDASERQELANELLAERERIDQLIGDLGGQQ